jgi:virginiamycin B lyase
MPSRPLIILALACALTGCSLSGGQIRPDASAFSRQLSAPPNVVQKGKGAQWVQFKPHTVSSLYSAMALGPDGNVWFIDENADRLVRISQSGSIKEFSFESVAGGSAVSMTVGADKDFYIGDESSSIIRVTSKGKAQAFAIPSGDGTSIDGMALGSDGNVWFAEFNHIAKITPSGKITEFAYPAGYSTNQYGGVTTGSDGNVWFAESSNNAIGRVVPSTGKITMFPIPVSCTPAAVVLGNDKNVWFFCLTSTPEIGSITPSGKVSAFAVGGSFGSNETEQFCARGPDGEPWCASGNDLTVFRVDTSSHTIKTFTPPLGSGVRPDAVVAGSDGNLWVDTAGGIGEIDVLVTNPMTVTPTALSFSAPGQKKTVSVSEHGTTSWTATSSNTAVAKVAQGGSKSSFNVTSVGKGSCKITISDAAANSVAVKVTVSS